VCHHIDIVTDTVTKLLLTLLLLTEERCGDISVEGGVGQIIFAMKKFMNSSGIQTWGAYALCRILYCNSK